MDTTTTIRNNSTKADSTTLRMASRMRSRPVGRRRPRILARALPANSSPLLLSKILPSLSPNLSNSNPINRANNRTRGSRRCRTFTHPTTKTSTLGSRRPTMASRLSSIPPCTPSRASSKGSSSNRRSRPNSLSSNSSLSRSRRLDPYTRTSSTARGTSSSPSRTTRTMPRRSSSSLARKAAVFRAFSGLLDKLVLP